MTFIQPSLLKPGDTVAIVSTARKISKEALLPAVQLLKSWGLVTKIGATIEQEYHQFAGTSQFRADDFQAMLDAPEVKAIWCARGGYGTIKMLDRLNFENFKLHPKWIIGYSDVTVLHLHLHNLGFQSIHATMPINVASNTPEALESLKAALFTGSVSTTFNKHLYKAKTHVKGPLIGGNLSMIYSVLGSNTAVNLEDKILFIEDLDEYLYHVDRMMMNLKRNGCFDKLKGLVVGGMTQMHDNTIAYGKSVEELIVSVLEEYDFPIYFQYPAGHLDNNTALLFGQEVTILTQENTVKLLCTK